MRCMQRAFALLELLVVIAVLAILLCLLLPAIGKVKAASRAAACESNLRQLGTLLYAYAAAADNRLPGSPDLDASPLWFSTLPSAKKQQLQCPDVASYATAVQMLPFLAPGEGYINVGWSGAYPLPELAADEFGTYGWNAALAGNRLSRIAAPSRVPSFADATRPLVLPVPPTLRENFPTPGFEGAQREFLLMQGVGIARHRDGIHIGFLDGHVEHVSLKEVLQFGWWPNPRGAGL